MATSQADGYADDLRDRVVAEIAAALDLDLAEVLPGCRLHDDYGCTVQDFVDLRAGLALAFSIVIPWQVVDTWKQVADVTAYIEGRMAPERITG